MKRSPLNQQTLRFRGEATHGFRRIVWGGWFWTITLGIAAFCAFSGPFGTFESLAWPERTIYWTAIAVVTGMAGVWLSEFTRVAGWPFLPHVLLVNMGFGTGVTCFVSLLKILVDPDFTWATNGLQMVVMVFPVAAAVFLVANRFMLSRTEVGLTEKRPISPKIFERLQSQTGATVLLTLTASDHYVEVTTDKGTELCLLRFADAVAETVPVQGFQIHRSHWVALDAIDQIDSRGNKPQVVLTSGKTLPISRTRVRQLREKLSNYSTVLNSPDTM